MVDIQSATAEIRRGKNIEGEKKEEETTGRKYDISASAAQGGHNDIYFTFNLC